MKKFYEAGVCHHTIEGLSWTLMEVTNQKKRKKKERQCPTHQKKRRFSLSQWTLDQEPENFYVWVYVMHNRGPSKFSCKRFLASCRGMWSWLLIVPLYSKYLPHNPLWPGCSVVQAMGYVGNAGTMGERAYLMHEIIPSSYYISVFGMVFSVSSRNNLHAKPAQYFTDLYCVTHFSRSNWI